MHVYLALLPWAPQTRAALPGGQAAEEAGEHGLWQPGGAAPSSERRLYSHRGLSTAVLGA